MLDSPKALITGITGQDGSYLAELLLEKGYEVHGIKRRASSFNTSRIDHLYQDPHETDPKLVLHYGDLTDSSNLIRIIQQVQPDEIYNLGAQSHVAVSFEAPEYTANSDALGTLRILEAVRILGLTETTRIYQASTSWLWETKQWPVAWMPLLDVADEFWHSSQCIAAALSTPAVEAGRPLKVKPVAALGHD